MIANKFSHPSLTILSSGLIFLLIFYVGYSLIDPNLYEYRDDGVITLSVGRHFVDYGFFGVSPSGPIVETSSSPLQTLIYALTYYFTKVDYATYSWLQTYVSTFLIGIIFGLFLVQKPISAIAVAAIAATILTFFYSFFLWHASGMENAISHVLYILTIFLLYRQIQIEKLNLFFAIPIFFTSIIRVEAILHVFVLLSLFSVFWWKSFYNTRAFLFSTIVIIAWGLFQGLRLFYFGDLLPNTAYAQDISVQSRILHFIKLDFGFIFHSLKLVYLVSLKQGWWIGLIFFPILLKTKQTAANKFLLLSVASLIASIILSLVLFGQARIDPPRTTTQLTVIIVLAITFSIIHAKDISHSINLSIKLLPIFIGAYFFVYAAPHYLDRKKDGIGPYYLGWSTKGFNAVRVKFEKMAQENNILRPTISNPDLGVMTWYKQFNVVDLGMLGTPELAKLRDKKNIGDYYLNYALPDFIESHGYWTKKYCNSIFLRQDFQEKYEMLGEQMSLTDVCDQNNPDMHFWIRRDVKINSGSAERKFIDLLQTNLNLSVISNEIELCKKMKTNCSYISRTVYKFIPELREKNIFDDALALFDQPLDYALLNGWKDPKTHLTILELVKNNQLD